MECNKKIKNKTSFSFFFLLLNRFSSSPDECRGQLIQHYIYAYGRDSHPPHSTRSLSILVLAKFNDQIKPNRVLCSKGLQSAT